MRLTRLALGMCAGLALLSAPALAGGVHFSVRLGGSACAPPVYRGHAYGGGHYGGRYGGYYGGHAYRPDYGPRVVTHTRYRSYAHGSYGHARPYGGSKVYISSSHAYPTRVTTHRTYPDYRPAYHSPAPQVYYRPAYAPRHSYPVVRRHGAYVGHRPVYVRPGGCYR